MKYGRHKAGCAASSCRCFIRLQLAVDTLQTTTTRLIDLEEEGGGVGLWALYLRPHGEPGASERLLSA